jgi:predicted phage terminase large subunit-like protein
MFKREWFKLVKAAPVGTRFVRGWDLAASTNDGAAYTAGVKIGKQPDGRYIIADVRRRRASPKGVEELIVSTASQDGIDCPISIPQDPGQAGLAQVRYLIGKLAGYSARATPETGSKVTRADPLAAQCEAGNVDILAGPWNEEFLAEAESFPYSTFLDQVDAASRAFSVLIAGPVGQSLVGTYGDRT